MILLNKVFDEYRHAYKLPHTMSVQAYEGHLMIGTECGKPLKQFHNVTLARSKLTIAEREFLCDDIIRPFLDKHAKHLIEYYDCISDDIVQLLEDEYKKELKEAGISFETHGYREAGQINNISHFVNIDGFPIRYTYPTRKEVNNRYKTINTWKISGPINLLTQANKLFPTNERNKLAKRYDEYHTTIEQHTEKRRQLEQLMRGHCPI
jgi:hypothetical protein